MFTAIDDSRTCPEAVPADVHAFCRARGIEAELALAVECVIGSFPEAESLNIRLEEDPDAGDRGVVVEAVLPAGTEALARHRACLRRWAAAIRRPALAAIWPAYTLARPE